MISLFGFSTDFVCFACQACALSRLHSTAREVDGNDWLLIKTKNVRCLPFVLRLLAFFVVYFVV